MRVLVTGSTSQQANPGAHRRSANFTGLVWETLRTDEKIETFWLEPSVRWTSSDLGQYDHVFVGLAPLMAMGANRVYGALSVIGELWNSKRLTLVVDAPDPDLVTRNLRSVLLNWPAFTKEFFSYRKEYGAARDPEVNDRLRAAAERLLHEAWPRTIVPGLPWTEPARIAACLPQGAAGRVSAVSLDGVLLERFGAPARYAPRLREWAYVRTADRKWLPSLGLGLPVRELVPNHRVATDPAHAERIRESVGLLVGPIRGEVWWTPKIAMALALGTPVFTDWHQSRRLGPEWTPLPAPHELAGPVETARLAADQYDSFAAAVPAPGAALGRLLRSAGVQNRPRRKAS